MKRLRNTIYGYGVHLRIPCIQVRARVPVLVGGTPQMTVLRAMMRFRLLSGPRK